MKFLAAYSSAAKVDRLNTVPLTSEVIRKIKDGLVDKYRGLNNSIHDVGDIDKDNITNTYWVPIKLGNLGKGTFETEGQAHAFAKLNGLDAYKLVEVEGPPRPGASVKQQGNGFYVEVLKPLNETDDLIRDFIQPTSVKKPGSYAGQLLSWIRGPEDTLSVENMQNRKVATYTPSVILRLFQQEGKYIDDLAKGKVKTDPVTGESVRPFFMPFMGFGCFGILIPLFLCLLAMKTLRFAFWGPRWGHMGHHHGPWGRHWENGVPPMFDEWHKKAHGEPTEEKKE